VKHNRVLIINSYAGSLTIAASQLGLDIIGSYEDAGWGLPVQRANFPKLNYVERLPWPKKNLQGVMVIAHPPCAAFSNQNNVRSARGTGADSFTCHKRVMRYALSQGCAGLAMESVPAILPAARRVHDAYARRYGYRVYRVLQNAVTFGVPQWRPRAWIIFAKLDQLRLAHRPVRRRVGEVMTAHGTELAPNSEIRQAFQRLGQAGYTEARVREELLSGEHLGSLLQIGKKVLGVDDVGPNHQVIRERWRLGGRFGSKLPRVLDPEGVATTVLRDSNFFVMGRELYLEEYLAVMGFPVRYKFPPKALKDFKCYLSKGVCPSVARWVLTQLRENLDGSRATQYVLRPGETLDLQVKRERRCQS
jgi:site-specific DNA-cytosine methylase